MSENETTIGRFRIRVVPCGGLYDDGRANEGAEASVEVLDLQNADPDYAPRGQLISRYYLSTLIAHERPHGISFHGGVPAWTMTPAEANLLVTWLRGGMRPARTATLRESLSRRRSTP